MNIIICGAGKVGFSISQQLSAQGHSVTVIDQSSEDIKKINDIDICEKWYDKNVLLIGDAAHAMRNDLGINVNINLADVSELIRCIDKDNIDNSLKLWEKNRKMMIYI